MIGAGEYVRIRSGGWTLSVLPEFAETSFAAFCGLPVSQYPAGVSPVVSSAHTEVRRFEYLGDRYFLKEYFFLGWKKHLGMLRRFRRLPAIARRLNESGFCSPRVIAFGQNGRSRRVVTEAVEDALDIWQVLFPDFVHYRGSVDDGFVYALGCTIGDFHRLGFCHGDLRWRNVLTRRDAEGWKFYFIDNDRTVKFYFGLPLSCRIKNLAQLLFSGLLVNWPQNDWELFLRGYFDHARLSPALQRRLVCRVEEKARQRLADRQQERKE